VAPQHEVGQEQRERWLQQRSAGEDDAGFRLTVTDVQQTGFVLIVAGALVGVFGSAVAVDSPGQTLVVDGGQVLPESPEAMIDD
jgi:hypothetical protein